MNYFLLDVGNTRLKWASLVAGDFVEGGAVVHRKQDLPALLTQHWAGFSKPDKVSAVCVAGGVIRDTLSEWIRQRWSCAIDFVQSPAQGNGISNSYAQPHKLGSDRWAAMVAARAMTPSPVCVVNCGSAVTIDVLDQQGLHRGGLILPGLHAMLDALVRHTELTAVDSIAPGLRLSLANDTSAAMSAGSVFAIVGAIEKTLATMQDELQTPLACYLAGGDAALIAEHLSCACQVQSDLVLRGLALIAQAT